MDIISSLLMFAVMFGFMYFLLIRPQKKQQEKMKNMLDSLAVGDKITTVGGLHGIIDEIDDQSKTVVLDCEGIYLTFDRRAVARITMKANESTVEAQDLGTNEPDTE